jgi:endonuclease G
MAKVKTKTKKSKRKANKRNRLLSTLLVLAVLGYYIGLNPMGWLSEESAESAFIFKKKGAVRRSCEGIEIPRTLKDVPERVLEKSNYTVSFNRETNIPNWVAWSIASDELIERESRSNNFQPDPELPVHEAVTTDDYKNSGYDRGHMCPAADNKYHWRAMDESFYMTNICPQNHNLNAGVWSTLEQQCRRWAHGDTVVHVVCGPILYGNQAPRYIGEKHKVRVPDAFFKVVLKGYEQGVPQGGGFIFENKAGKKSLSHYDCTINEVEEITGIDFFYHLADKEEERIESKMIILKK